MAEDLPLFRRWPALREALPREPLVEVPTPVGELPIPGLPEGAVQVKHDERSCPHYGGNKPRKLEFVLGEARRRGARRLVTTGGLGTNHGLATAILGRRAGFEVTLVLVDQPVTPEVERKLLLFAAFGAELVYGRHVAGAAAQLARVVAGSRLRGERPLLVPTGGSSPAGNAGFVSAGLELAEQIRRGEIPPPGEIVVPVGTGGTQVGLVIGLRLAGLPTPVVGALVTDILPPRPRRQLRAARRTLELLRRVEPAVPQPTLSQADFPLDASALGAGYGAATAEAREAVEVARAAGLALETTYTGKALALLRRRFRDGAAREPVLFWNTYNAVDVEATAPRRLSVESLPEAFRGLLAGGSSPS